MRGAALRIGRWVIGSALLADERVAILVLMPVALGTLTPHTRRWIHRDRDVSESTHVRKAGGAAAQ